MTPSARMSPPVGRAPADRDDPVEAIARAVLYEGYVLWPYRRSAVKNRQRWTFGGVYPRGFCAEADQGDAWEVRCACLVEGPPGATVTVEARFLQAVHRQVFARGPEGLRPVDELRLPGALHLTWDEARERRVAAPPLPVGELAETPHLQAVAVPGGTEDEAIPAATASDRDPGGAHAAAGGPTPAGLFHRSWEPLAGLLELGAEPLEPDLVLLEAVLKNASPWRGADRREAQHHTFLATHLVLRADGGTFVSLTAPPAHRADDAELCRNQGVWPVLTGESGRTDTLLASPIILEDHPRVAPESPGDLFDGGEIDQLLTLNILALTDEEKEEMAATDPRTRKILERTEGLSRDELMQLHGTFRDPRRRP